MGETLKARTSLPDIEAAEVFNQISLGLMHGAINIRTARGSRAYHPGHTITLEIRAEEDEEKGSIHIDLFWRVPLSVTTS